jgi:predicted membrane metal-binding protein
VQASPAGPEGGLLAGILLGARGGIPDALNTTFQVTGTAHIVAISGFNTRDIAMNVIHAAEMQGPLPTVSKYR